MTFIYSVIVLECNFELLVFDLYHFPGAFKPSG